MSTSSLSVLSQSARSLEWLIDPDALLSSTALSTGQLGTLGPIASLAEGGIDLSSTGSAVSALNATTTDIANQAVLDVHAALENIGHEVLPLNGPLHALTNLGETVGLGKIGESGTLLTDLLAVPVGVADGGGLVSASPVLNDLGHVISATDGLFASIAGTATAGNLLASDGLVAPVSNLANAAILDIHANIEGLGHDIPVLNEALHGLTFLGETVGLGKLGESGTLLTDVAALPSDLLHGDGLASLSPIVGDLGSVTGAATGLIDDVARIPSSLLGSGASLDGVLAPVTSLLDGLTGGHPGAPLDSVLTGLTGGEGVLAPVSSLAANLTGGALTGDLLGSDGTLQPVGDAANGLIDSVHASIENLGHDIPILNLPLHEVINTGTTIGLGALGEGSSLLTDTANLPGDILGGNSEAALGQVVGDISHVAEATGGIIGSVPGAIDGVLSGNAGASTPIDGVLGGLAGHGGGALAPVTSVVDGVTGGLADGGGVLAPVTALPDGVSGGHTGTPLDGALGGLMGSDGGVLTPITGVLGGLTGSGSEGTHPLIDVAAGPATPTPTADVAVLTSPAEPSHTVQVGAVGVGAEQPSLVSAGLLSGDGITFLSTGGIGGDALIGHALDIVHTTTSGSADAEASHSAGLDLGIAAIDLGGHVDAQHTDPTPHGATSGLHLLGL